MKKKGIKKLAFYKLTNQGPFRFPVNVESIGDMLRYDACFTTDENPSTLAYISFYGDGYRCEPTIGRWHSFGYDIQPLAGEHPTLNADKWFTCRRSGLDDLKRVTLGEVLRTK